MYARISNCNYRNLSFWYQCTVFFRIPFKIPGKSSKKIKYGIKIYGKFILPHLYFILEIPFIFQICDCINRRPQADKKKRHSVGTNGVHNTKDKTRNMILAKVCENEIESIYLEYVCLDVMNRTV